MTHLPTHQIYQTNVKKLPKTEKAEDISVYFFEDEQLEGHYYGGMVWFFLCADRTSGAYIEMQLTEEQHRVYADIAAESRLDIRLEISSKGTATVSIGNQNPETPPLNLPVSATDARTFAKSLGKADIKKEIHPYQYAGITWSLVKYLHPQDLWLAACPNQPQPTKTPNPIWRSTKMAETRLRDIDKHLKQGNLSLRTLPKKPLKPNFPSLTP